MLPSFSCCCLRHLVVPVAGTCLVTLLPRTVQALQCGYSLPPGVLESTVMDCHGDLEAAARIMLEQRGQPASSSQALPAGILL